MVYSADHSKAVVTVLVLLFVALWFVLRGDLFYVLPGVILFFCFSVLLALRLPRLGKRELILVLLYVCSICACLVSSISSSSWCLGRAAVCNCGTPRTFLLSFLCSAMICLLADPLGGIGRLCYVILYKNQTWFFMH